MDSQLACFPTLQELAEEAAVTASLSHIQAFLDERVEADAASGWLEEAMDYTAGTPAAFLTSILPETGVGLLECFGFWDTDGLLVSISLGVRASVP